MDGSPLLTPDIRASVAERFARAVTDHLNHTTCGIVSWKAQVRSDAANPFCSQRAPALSCQDWELSFGGAMKPSRLQTLVKGERQALPTAVRGSL